MRSGLVAAAGAATMVFVFSNTVSATELRLSYNYTARIGVYPSDDPPAGNQYTLKGSGSALFDADTFASTPFLDVTNPIDGSELTLSFGYPNQNGLFAAIINNGQNNDGISFEADGDFGTPTPLGRYTFNLGLTDIYTLSVPGGTGPGDGFNGPPTFEVKGAFVLSAVPLPSAAPLFGAALAALGTVGYRVRRRTKAAV